MGTAREIFRWVHIDPHATVGAYVHGYGTRVFAAHCIVPALRSNVPSGAVQVKAQMTSTETSVHVDGTIARTIFVENRSVGPQPSISVTLFDFVQIAR